MKVSYETLMFLGVIDTDVNQLGDKKRCDMAYELLSQAYRLIPIVDEDGNKHVSQIYEAARNSTEEAMEGIS